MKLLDNLSLIKLCSACAKQNAEVITASDAGLLLAKQILSDLVRRRPSSLIINFEQVIKSLFSYQCLIPFFFLQEY